MICLASKPSRRVAWYFRQDLHLTMPSQLATSGQIRPHGLCSFNITNGATLECDVETNVVIVWSMGRRAAAMTRSAGSPPRPPHHQLFATLLPASPRIAMMSRPDDDNASARSIRRQPSSRSLFSVPTPIKQLFDQFPLITYPVNDFPQRAPQHHDTHVLYVFTTDGGSTRGAPSHNPACLKWQVSPCRQVPIPHHQAHIVAGVPQVFQNPLQNRLGKQPCLSQRLATLHNTFLTRSLQANTACSLEQTATMGHEQQ